MAWYSGVFGPGDMNDCGLRLLEFANIYKLTLAITLFPYKTSRKTTWHSPDVVNTQPGQLRPLTQQI